MKTLWFTNTSVGAAEYLKLKTMSGGWLSALADSLKTEIELHVAFYHNAAVLPFDYNGIGYHPIDMKLSKLKILKNVLSTGVVKDEDDLQEYLEVIARVKPDLIHVHGTENPFGCIVHHTNRPVVFSIQGIISSILEKYYSGIDKSYGSAKNKETLKEYLLQGNFNTNYKIFTAQKSIEQNNLQKAKFIIGRTKWDERVTRVLAPESKYFHNDELLRSVFYEHEWSFNFNGKLKLYTTNGNSIFKGFETICKAVQILIKAGLEVEWKVAGIKETDAIVGIAKSILGNNYPTKGLTLLGAISQDEIISNLKEANIYVMPSHIENSPNNLCEAMILGLPCVATFAGGTSSLLEDGKEGILIQDGDAYSMAGAILELFNNPNYAIEQGKAARNKAVARHDKARIVNGLLEVYQNVLVLEDSYTN